MVALGLTVLASTFLVWASAVGFCAFDLTKVSTSYNVWSFSDLRPQAGLEAVPYLESAGSALLVLFGVRVLAGSRRSSRIDLLFLAVAVVPCYVGCQLTRDPGYEAECIFTFSRGPGFWLCFASTSAALLIGLMSSLQRAWTSRKQRAT